MSKWVKVEDKLPEYYCRVLTYNPKLQSISLKLAGPDGIWSKGNLVQDATHWMPLPDPPREEVTVVVNVMCNDHIAEKVKNAVLEAFKRT